MQRFVGLGGRVALAAPVAVAAHPPAAQHGAGPRLVTEESHEDYVNIGFEQQPVAFQEVSEALGNLSSGGHRPFVGTLPRPASSVPLVQEITGDSESETGSDTEVNALMAGGDCVYAARSASYDAGEELSAMDLLTASVTNLLNNEAVVTSISQHLYQDPAFAALLDRHVGGPNLGLPAPARALLLMGVEEEDDEDYVSARGSNSGQGSTTPLVDLLRAIERGMAVAAIRVGTAFCHLGNMLRGLGESLSIALAGMEESAAPAGAAVVEGAQRNAAHFNAAMSKVACAVAVLVLTRRVALARMAV